MSFTPTSEQLAIVAAARDTTDNLLISARAGAAKTSTLVLIAQALPKVNMLCLAFNKKIADEMREKLPPSCTSLTLNSLGHRAWAQTTGKRLALKDNKCYTLLQEELEHLSRGEQDEIYQNMGPILKAIQQSKSAGHVPDAYAATHPCQRLMTDDEFFSELDDIFSPLEQDLILTVLTRSLEMGFAGTVDFADQLLLPTVFRAIFPPFSLVLVDEAQDLSELNHQMLKKLVRRRIIAVGDQAQAIYAFRGAHESGMAEMKHKFSMTELSLTTTFRCPEAIVNHVRWRTPDIKHWEGNPNPGEIHRLDHWSLDQIPDDAAVICRNNAPLFSLAVKFLRAGRYPNLWGNDIGRGLLKVMEKLGARSMQQSAALQALETWREAQAKKVKNKSALEDRAECIRVFLRATPTLGEAITFCEHILRSEGRVNLMTGHKSKGHEFDHVYFLDEKLIGDRDQELNLRYVICTRAKRTLTYVEMRTLED